MKKYLLTTLCMVSMLMSHLVPAQSAYLIKGEISGLKKAHAYAYLRPVHDEITLSIDSVPVRDGKFIFTGSVKEPDLYILSIQNLPETVELVLENTTVTLTAKAGEMSQARISGSALTDELTDYRRKHSNAARKEMAAHTRMAEELLAKGDSAKAREHRNAGWRIKRRQDVIAEQYIKEHPQSFLSLLLVGDDWTVFSNESNKKFLQGLPGQLQTHSIARRVAAEMAEAEKLAEATKIGAMAPDFSQPDTAGQVVSLRSFRGKYLLIDFWASWCGPCRASHPELIEAYQKFREQGLEILSVSLDDDKEKWLQAIQKDQLLWTQVSDLKGSKNQVAELYGIKAIPRSYLIDPEGKIVAKGFNSWYLVKQAEKCCPGPDGLHSGLVVSLSAPDILPAKGETYQTPVFLPGLFA